MKRVILQLLVFLDLDDLSVYQKVVKYRFSGLPVRIGLYKVSNYEVFLARVMNYFCSS